MIWKFYAVSAALSWSKRASVAEDLALVLPILTLGLLFFRMANKFGYCRASPQGN